MQAPLLGVDLAAHDEAGGAVTGEVGEPVIIASMLSMRVLFWGDEHGSRYRDPYFARP